MKKTPTIKGVFVMSHIRALERIKGEEAVYELVSRMGKRVRYSANENVPVREEVRIIEHVLDLIAEKPVPAHSREFEAGKLHFKNFSETPYGTLILKMFKFKTALLSAPVIARRVFQGVDFISEDLVSKSIRVSIKNSDYPIDHFRGFFQAWMDFSKLTGTVRAEDAGDGSYVYVAQWQ